MGSATPFSMSRDIYNDVRERHFAVVAEFSEGKISWSEGKPDTVAIVFSLSS
jgi:hypothetical protein